MDLELSFNRLKILFINLYMVLYKAATLNFYKLQFDIKDVRDILKAPTDAPLLLSQTLTLLISALLTAKFIFGYISLAANVIAIFPILLDDQPELLLPTMVSQAVENILLSLLEILLSYITVRYYFPGKVALFVIFVLKMVIKMSLSVSTLNVYSELYHRLMYPIVYSAIDEALGEHDSNERFLRKQSLL